MEYRREHDTMGEIDVPADRYWAAQTQRSLAHFKIGTERMPMEIIRALAIVKSAAADANVRFGKLDGRRAEYIKRVCDEIVRGALDAHFPLSVWQTGSGTQTNMNVNEVVTNRGNELAGEKLLHANDHVNMSQSTNDIFPTAMHVSAVLAITGGLLPALRGLAATFLQLQDAYPTLIKTGRTHLQDATPIRFAQEVGGWRAMLTENVSMLEAALCPLSRLAIGGTAVGTGLNAPEGFDAAACEGITKRTGIPFSPDPNKFHALTSKDALVFTHGALKALSGNLMKIANDVRLLSCGPRCGLAEIEIPKNEPGSSIMPGKVNPTQCEALTMVCVQVMGNDAAIGFAASQGNFELNVYMPVIANAFLQSVRLLADATVSFDAHCAAGIRPNERVMEQNLQRSLMLVTNLSPIIGYETAASVAKEAYEQNKTLEEVVLERKLMDETALFEALRPERMV